MPARCTMRYPKVRVIHGHREGCVCLQPQNHPDNPLWMPSAECLERDAAGRKLPKNKSGWYYLRFCCNSTGCPAEVLVPYCDITAFAHRLMVKALGGVR